MESLAVADDELSLWNSYEYLDPVQGDRFHEVHYEQCGGPAGQPFIWADDTMWSIDTPENPHSILSLLFYHIRYGNAPIDLREASLSFYLRGDNLDLKNAKCFFWITSYNPLVARWHYVDQPLEISNGFWGDPIQITLLNDSSLWHRSFSADPLNPYDLNQALGACFSYGFSFVGFSEKVTGKLSLSHFEIRAKNSSQWLFSSDQKMHSPYWQTVSRKQGKQVAIDNRDLKESISLRNDFLRIPHSIPYSYLAFIHRDHSTGGIDLRNAFYLFYHLPDHLDLKNGDVHFFVEHSESNTIWIFRAFLPAGQGMGFICENEIYWFRLSGNLSLEQLLIGKEGGYGYNYLGFMVVNVSDHPEGHWELSNYYLSQGLI